MENIVEWLIKQPETIQIQGVFEKIQENLVEHSKDIFNPETWGHWWADCVEFSRRKELSYCTSSTENALDYLEAASEALVSKSEHRWKRIILGLHGAVYGLAISVLASNNFELVLNKQGKLIPFKRSIEKVMETRGTLNTSAPSPLFSDEEKETLFQLHSNFRNQFQHFIPVNWVILESGLPLICMITLNPIIILACNLFGLKNDVQRVRLINCVHQIAHLLLLEHAEVLLQKDR